MINVCIMVEIFEYERIKNGASLNSQEGGSLIYTLGDRRVYALV